MKNFQQTPKQKRAAIAANKTCFVNSRKQTWQANDASYGSEKHTQRNAMRELKAMHRLLGW